MHNRACLPAVRLRSLFIAIAFVGLGGALRAQETVVLVGSGSSVPAPLYNRWAIEFNKRSPNTQFKYLPTGTKEGIADISHGSGDFGAGEVPLTSEERAASELIELPVALIGIVPVYNVPGVKTGLHFSGDVLAEIFLGDIKSWNAAAIERLNPGVTLPDMPIHVVYRPSGKGSNYIFTDFLSKTSAKFRTRVGTTASPKWPVGGSAERSSDMAEKVRQQPGAIGYVELAYAVKSGLAQAVVLNAAGKFVKATSATITAACEQVEAPGWDKFAPSLVNAAGEDSFPISSFTWAYLRSSSSDPMRAGAIGAFLNWVLSDGQTLAEEEGYARLPSQLVTNIKARVKSIR
jgi:phosphate transport system substrate-binding protein